MLYIHEQSCMFSFGTIYTNKNVIMPICLESKPLVCVQYLRHSENLRFSQILVHILLNIPLFDNSGKASNFFNDIYNKMLAHDWF